MSTSAPERHCDRKEPAAMANSRNRLRRKRRGTLFPVIGGVIPRQLGYEAGLVARDGTTPRKGEGRCTFASQPGYACAQAADPRVRPVCSAASLFRYGVLQVCDGRRRRCPTALSNLLQPPKLIPRDCQRSKETSRRLIGSSAKGIAGCASSLDYVKGRIPWNSSGSRTCRSASGECVRASGTENCPLPICSPS